jgi:hypothetical protein
MADLSRRIRGAMHERAIHDQTRTESGAEREKDEVLELPIAAHAKAMLGERSRVAVVLDMNRKLGMCRGELILESQSVPSGQMRRIQQHTLADAQRAADRDADGNDVAARCACRLAHFAHRRVDARQRFLRWTLGLRGHLAPLQDLAASRAFDHRDLGGADVESQDRLGSCHVVHRRVIGNVSCHSTRRDHERASAARIST